MKLPFFAQSKTIYNIGTAVAPAIITALFCAFVIHSELNNASDELEDEKSITLTALNDLLEFRDKDRQEEFKYNFGADFHY